MAVDVSSCATRRAAGGDDDRTRVRERRRAGVPSERAERLEATTLHGKARVESRSFSGFWANLPKYGLLICRVIIVSCT